MRCYVLHKKPVCYFKSSYVIFFLKKLNTISKRRKNVVVCLKFTILALLFSRAKKLFSFEPFACHGTHTTIAEKWHFCTRQRVNNLTMNYTKDYKPSVLVVAIQTWGMDLESWLPATYQTVFVMKVQYVLYGHWVLAIWYFCRSLYYSWHVCNTNKIKSVIRNKGRHVKHFLYFSPFYGVLTWNIQVVQASLYFKKFKTIRLVL